MGINDLSPSDRWQKLLHLQFLNLLFKIHCSVWEKNSTLEEIQLINKRTADALCSHQTNKSRGLLGDSWSSDWLQRGSPKLREALGIHRMFWAVAQSPLAPHSWLGPASTPPSRFWGTPKAHHLAPQEKVLGGIEVKQHNVLIIFSLSGRYRLSSVQEGQDFWVLIQQQQQCSLEGKKRKKKAENLLLCMLPINKNVH